MRVSPRDICRYADALRARGLQLSVHFRMELFSSFPPEEVAFLYPYNCHPDPYCSRIKNTCREACLRANQDAIDRAAAGAPVVLVCHADMLEYHQDFFRFGEPAGVVTVSGWRAPVARRCKTPEEAALFERLPAASLPTDVSTVSPMPLPLEQLETDITPLCVMLSVYFEQLEADAPADPASREYRLLLLHLNENHTSVSLRALCDTFHCSPSHLSHLFQKHAGCSLHAYCNRLRVQDAAVLLSSTPLSVTEIAQTVGFSDASYFVRVFRREKGVTPRAYRCAQPHKNAAADS